MRSTRYIGIIGAIGLLATLTILARSSLQTAHSSGLAPISIGALYPLSGSQAVGGSEEYHGLRIATQLVNAAGGVNGRRISFTTVNAPSADSAPDAVDRLARSGVKIVVGSYGSTISLPASDQAQRDNLIFWESGAVATMITQRGFPNVFRTVTTGNSLGRAAARYARDVVTPHLKLAPAQVRTAILYVNDAYGSSVGQAMTAEARSQGLDVTGVLTYDPYHVNMARLVSRLKAMRPDVVLVAAYVQDAIAFRLQTLRQHLHAAAMIGTSSAFCMPAFGVPLGQKAVGLFASDKPDATFNPKALLPAARQLRGRAMAAYRSAYHATMSAPALAGFVAGWVLFHEVLPNARTLNAADVRAAALRVNLPYGSEVNGAGVRFAGPGAPDEGQNLRAISVIWQWQRPGKAAVVYPQSYATAQPHWIPLPGWQHA
jgi:branched-chain amino acid transport system substrate-binding protein